MITPYAHQFNFIEDIYESQRRHRNTLAVLATGGGKTVVFSKIAADYKAPVCAIAHRKELVLQMSVTFAKFGIQHRIVGPDDLVKLAVRKHITATGSNFYHPSAPTAVASIGSLNSRKKKLKEWGKSVGLWIQDEAHHVLRGNQWGSIEDIFPNSQGLGVTATPFRSDGRGLGRVSDGIMDDMVVGPSMRWLIDSGYLTDYRIFCPPSDINTNTYKMGSTGDFTSNSVVKATKHSTVMGDAVREYLARAAGLLGVAFAPSVDTAREMAANFIAAGVPAEVVSSKNTDVERTAALARFENRETLVLVNVDLFGEGFDLPQIEVVMMVRATASKGLYIQQFGRVLRTLLGKKYGIIIDHVGNVLRHGLPDAETTYTLNGRTKSERDAEADDGIPLRSCSECTQPYARVLASCPFCGVRPVPTLRSGPEHVDGDLIELDAATMAAMRGAIAHVDRDVEQVRIEAIQKRMPQMAQRAAVNRHHAMQAAQAVLRERIALWAGHQRMLLRPDSESYRRFFHTYGVDVATAQTLGTKDALELSERIIISS